MNGNEALNPDRLLEEAQHRCQLQDFGPADFEAPFRLLCRSLRDEAGLHENGFAMQGERLSNLLCNRLRIADYLQRHPEILQEQIVAPIIIAALPRTGTTMLHRFLAADPRMHAVLWYECRNPAPLPEGEGQARDPRITAAEEEIRIMLEHMPGLDAMHPMEAEGPDEEIMLLEHAFCSGMPMSMANVPSYNEWEHQNSDHRAAYAYLKQLLQFLQWQKKRRGEAGQRWVLKAPEHLGHTGILLELFPDATIVQGHRDPLQTIPSIASLIHSGWAAYSEQPDKHLIGRIWADRCNDFMDNYMDMRQRAAGSMIDLWYQDLIDDPFAQAQHIYQHIGMDLSSEAETAMAEWRAANRREKRAAHHYTLEEFGFTEDDITTQFANYRDQFILNR